MLLIAIQSLYALWWDIRMDWDLGHNAYFKKPFGNWSGSTPQDTDQVPLRDNTEASPIGTLPEPAQSPVRATTEKPRFLLRPQLLLFSSSYPYYLAIIINVTLRCSWLFRAYYLEPSLTGLEIIIPSFFETQVYLYISQVLELLRRWIWIFFRIEHEYLKNYHDE